MDKYEEKLLEIAKNGILKIYTEEENIQIIKEMNKGVNEFIQEQKYKEQIPQNELKIIIK